MDQRDHPWSAVNLALREVPEADAASPKTRRFDDGDPVNKRFLRFISNTIAHNFGDHETKLDHSVLLKYDADALRVECLFRQPRDDSHSFHSPKAHYANTAAVQSPDIEWDASTRHKRVLLHLTRLDAGGMPSAQVTKVAVDGLKKLEALIKVHRPS